jgi:hypothetical protein
MLPTTSSRPFIFPQERSTGASSPQPDTTVSAKDKKSNEQIRLVIHNLLFLESPKVFSMALLFFYAPFVAVLQFLIAVRPAFLWQGF